MDEPKRTFKQKAYQGLKEYLAISLYLWLVFGLFVLYKSVLLSEQHFSLLAHGVALFNALALGKIMLIAQELHFADKFKERLKGLGLSLSLLFFALSLLSKPTFVSLPLLICLLDFHIDKSRKNFILNKIPFFTLLKGLNQLK